MHHEQPSLEELKAIGSTDVIGADGDSIGRVDEIWVDDDSGQPEYLKLDRGAFGGRDVVVPVAGAEIRGDNLYVPYSLDQLNAAPDANLDEEDFEASRRGDLDEYWRGARGDSGESVVRSEEELDVGKQQVETGRARLRKYVETEPVSMDVELQRETARVVSERIDEPVSEAELGQDEVEVTLRGEKPVVEKQVVAKERVGLEKDVETERTTVSDEVRKERVDLDSDS